MEQLTIADLYAELTAPFPLDYIELKPGAVSKDRSKALALAYVDARAYMDRLDTVVGPDNWSVEYRPIASGSGIICRLTLLGIVREDVGEASQEDPNAHRPLSSIGTENRNKVNDERLASSSA